MPFGEYADFKSCVEANQDKKSPEGYCASIEKKITGEWPGVKKMVPGTIRKALVFVTKTVSINTSSYEGSHGRHPRFGPYVGARMHQTSQSPWMVEIGGKEHEFRGSYKDAMTQAKTKAREMGAGSVKVLP